LFNRVISTFCAIIVGPIHANYYILAVKGEAFPQHTYGHAGGRVCIAPTHLEPRHCMGACSQGHTPAALYHWGKGPRVPIGHEGG
jgi:hypothetical protein